MFYEGGSQEKITPHGGNFLDFQPPAMSRVWLDRAPHVLGTRHGPRGLVSLVAVVIADW